MGNQHPYMLCSGCDLGGDSTQNKFGIGRGVPFERIRRITGYLVGGLDRFNNAKRAEVEDRVKHSLKTAGKH